MNQEITAASEGSSTSNELSVIRSGAAFDHLLKPTDAELSAHLGIDVQALAALKQCPEWGEAQEGNLDGYVLRLVPKPPCQADGPGWVAETGRAEAGKLGLSQS